MVAAIVDRHRPKVEGEMGQERGKSERRWLGGKRCVRCDSDHTLEDLPVSAIDCANKPKLLPCRMQTYAAAYWTILRTVYSSTVSKSVQRPQTADQPCLPVRSGQGQAGQHSSKAVCCMHNQGIGSRFERSQ